MKLFVWDFHGVLEIGNEYRVREISNIALEQLGFKERLSAKQCEQFYGLKWYEYFEKLLPNSEHATHMALQEISLKYSDEHSELIPKYAKPTEHSHEVLETILKNKDSKQILISNCTPVALEMFVEGVNVTKYFQSIIPVSTKSEFKTKKEALESYLESYLIKEESDQIQLEQIQLNKTVFDKIISIGDSPGDIAILDNKPNSTTYLFSHPGKPFRECNPNYRIRDLRIVLKELD